MSCEIYYFSGTGNSLHVARELEKRIPDTILIPVVSLKDKESIKAKADTVGFVFPLHFITMPGIVKNTIEKIDLNLTKYIFTVTTRQGTPCSSMLASIEKMLNEKGKSLDSYLILNMANNDPKFKTWHNPTAEELERFESDIQKRLDSFQDVIKNKVKWKEKDSNATFPLSPFMERFSFLIAQISGDGRESFYSDSKCKGCGTCEKVCLSQKIKLIDGKPIWQKSKKCFSCYACLNYCPAQSVQLKSSVFMKLYTEINGRYSHPEAGAEDIAAQK